MLDDLGRAACAREEGAAGEGYSRGAQDGRVQPLRAPGGGGRARPRPRGKRAVTAPSPPRQSLIMAP
eukprot:1181963-Prorocentrum_minimum.AAC.2